jgi:hypothetical protein
VVARYMTAEERAECERLTREVDTSFTKLLKGRPRKFGVFDSLTPDQQKAALAYRGEENHGSDEFKRTAK